VIAGLAVVDLLRLVSADPVVTMALRLCGTIGRLERMVAAEAL
jgi:hypothetical protein